MNRMKLDEALHAAREKLASTPVPEQDAAVAKAHMLAAFHRAQTATPATPLANPASEKKRSRIANLLGGFTGGVASNGGASAARLSGRLGQIVIAGVTILLIVWLLMPVNISATSGDLLGVSNNSKPTSLANLASGFIPLVSSEALAEAQHGWIVPTELPLSQLATLGLPFDATRAGETVRAELLMNESGELLAVRLLHDEEVASYPAAEQQSALPAPNA